MVQPEAAIFDLDGTLLDTLNDLATAGNEVLEQKGFPTHPTDAYRYFVGDGLKVLIERITPPGLSAEEIDNCCTLFATVYAKIWDKTSGPYQGIVSMLGMLKSHGIRCAVLSNKPHRFTEKYIDRFFPDFDFEVVFGQRDGVPKKPDPAGALEIARIMNVHPDSCLYIGDTAVDMQTGNGAGMHTVGVLWGFREQKELEDNNAEIIVSSPMEIVEYVYSTR